jgi:hypothetical protein
MTTTFEQVLKTLPLAGQLRVLHTMVDDLLAGRDTTIAALRQQADAVGAKLVLVGGVAVILHGYPRSTTDRDVLVDYRTASDLANCLMENPDWERLEIRQYAFLYRPTHIVVDFLVSRDLMDLGRPYCFPDVDAVEMHGSVEGVPVIGLHDLMYLKLLASRTRDLGDLMELCKCHLDIIQTERVLHRLEPDDELRVTFLNLLKKAPLEIAGERRLGQGNPQNYRHLKDT